MDGAPPEDVEIDGGILTIRAVRREDQGSYLCRATNTQGSTEARAQLYVKGREILTKEDVEKEVSNLSFGLYLQK